MIFSTIKPFVFYQIMVDSFDITWNATAVAFWGILESSLALVIACLPALNRGPMGGTESDEHLRRTSSGELERKGGGYYPRITVQRSFHLTEERASVLEQTFEDYIPKARVSVDVMLPPTAKRFGGSSRRTTPPSLDDSEVLTTYTHP
ncbi:uncharacterized protein DFL_008701 [Arthrobotrys flagrans]|uniref:Uncharacterized protein n=1 Tax=Arthrobotrys flagrans TaxID=97331 RepID=A0A436ZPJ3_ARTFL|nr:hypothetical protein DFL_008701 [Arthrobotrys flagrans]